MAADEFVYRGNLAETPLPEMLATIHRHGVPGVMAFTAEDVTKRVFFVDGDVIFATSSDRSESLGDFLLREGRITDEQYRESSDEMLRSPGTRHGSVLVQMGFLTQEQLGEAVREQVQSLVWSVFNWSSGAVTFRVGRFRDDEVYKIKIPTPRVILSGCRRLEDGKAVTTRLGGRNAVFGRLEVPSHLESLELEEAERRLLELVDGKRTLFQLCEKGPLGAGQNARVLYALAVLGLIERESTGGGGIKIQVRSQEA
jgi:hypothetical protein